MSLSDRWQELKTHILPENIFAAKSNPGRRRFLEMAAGVPAGIVAGLEEDLLSVLGNSHSSKRGEMEQEEVPVGSEYEYLIHPLKDIDLVCNKIGLLLESPHRSTVTEAMRIFLHDFGPDSQSAETKKSRRVIEKAYARMGSRLANTLGRLNRTDVGGSQLSMLGRLWYPWAQLHYWTVASNKDLINFQIPIDDMRSLVSWLEPMADGTGNHEEEQKKYLPPEKQTPLIIDAVFERDYKEAHKYTRSPQFDRQYAISYYAKKGEMLPDNFDELYPQSASSQEYVHLVSQVDIDALEKILETIEEFMPLSLCGISTVQPGDLKHYTQYRGNYRYMEQSVRLGNELNILADWLYSNRGNLSRFFDANSERNLDTALWVLMHEIFHSFDPRNFTAQGNDNLHPEDLLNYCTTYVGYFERVQKIFELPEREKDEVGWTSDTFTALFFADVLPIFGQDELEPHNLEMFGSLKRELDELSLIFSSLNTLPQSDLEKIGLSNYFSSRNNTPLQVWKMFCRNDYTTGDQTPQSYALRSYASKFPEGAKLLSPRALTPGHIEELQKLVEKLSQGNSNLLIEMSELSQDVLKLKSFYQLLSAVACQRLIKLHRKEGRSNELSQTIINTRYSLGESILSQLAHCLVGPHGQYAPTKAFQETWGSLVGDPAQKLDLATAKSTERNRDIQLHMGGDKKAKKRLELVSSLRDNIWQTQLELEEFRPLMLGRDISENLNKQSETDASIPYYQSLLAAVRGKLNIAAG